ncbi:expressed unknown protein [Ectocarpus siliculosus]|uniref:Uncharacterized protein n=1 Tax=Ectocarpus siliculosus TaxID=2880 RepID=D8LJB9_ECTSI|nr:expressed unknown protein [Ectocarpus siliculosus]|eukprot:CBN79452.1 expressed unknown protein [Ectocarpus siliculosus]
MRVMQLVLRGCLVLAAVDVGSAACIIMPDGTMHCTTEGRGP